VKLICREAGRPGGRKAGRLGGWEVRRPGGKKLGSWEAGKLKD